MPRRSLLRRRVPSRRDVFGPADLEPTGVGSLPKISRVRSQDISVLIVLSLHPRDVDRNVHAPAMSAQCLIVRGLDKDLPR